jgi:hypothetical protein
MSMAIGGSNQNSETHGVFVDVRDFGAKPIDGFDNTPAFQAAIDYVCSKNGGTVYIPASNSWPNYWWLEKPLFINEDHVTIEGDGENSTYLRTWGPAVMFTRHPRFWYSQPNYVDSDTGQTVPARDSSNNFIFENRYKVDLYRFTANGDLKAGASGVPPIDALIAPNQFYGIRPRNMVKGIFPGNFLATGAVQGWESRKQATFEFITFSHDRVLEGGIAGMGEWSNPDPWLMSGNSTEFHFCMSLTDDTLMNKAVAKIRFAQPQTKGLHRIAVQIDWDLRQISVFVDRVQVAYTVTFDDSSIPSSDLFNKYNSFARWEYSEFTIGSRNRTSAANEYFQAPASDFSVLAVKVCPSLRYSNRGVGQSLAKIDGTAINDADVIQFSPKKDSLARLYVSEGTGCDLMTHNDEGGRGYGMLVPVGGGPKAISGINLKNFCIVGIDGFYQSDGITMGPYLHANIENVTVTRGFFNGIGSLNAFISYPLFMTNCRLLGKGNGFFGVNQSGIFAKNITFGAIGRSAIRLVGCGSHWENGMTDDFEETAEAFFLGYSGLSLGAGHRFENFMIDTEGTRTSPRISYFYLQKGTDVSNNGLHMKLVSIGNSSGVPVIHLDDPWPLSVTVNFPGFVEFDSCSFVCEGPLVRVKGRDWVGSFNTYRWWCADSVVDVVPSPNVITTKVRSIHRDLSSPPNMGGWSKGSHDIVVANQAEGGVAGWNCDRNGFEGTASPPLWTPSTFRNSRRKNVLSGNIFANLFAEVSAKHPQLPTSLTKFGTTVDFASWRILEHILNGGPGLARDKFGMIIDPVLTHRAMTHQDGHRKSANLDNNSNLWNSATGGIKTNKQEIILNQFNSNRKLHSTNFRLRPASFFLNLGDINWNPSTVNSVFSGRFQNQKPLFFNDETLTVPVGNLKFGLAQRDGSWSILATNRILDYLFGNMTLSKPTTFFIGLSKTPVLTDGTGVTEITTGGYARVAVPLGWNNFRMHDEFGSTWSNSIPISFPAPTTDWGDFDWFFISDAATGGNIWASGPLNRTVSVKAGESAPCFMPQGLQIQI